MTSVLILGAGRTGAAIAGALLEHTVCRVWIAARDERRLEAVASALSTAFGVERLSARVLDAADRSVTAALEPYDLVIVAATIHEELPAIARAAIAARTGYVDLWYSPQVSAQVLALGDSAAAAGVRLLTQAGLQPGLPAILARAVASHLEPPQRIVVASCGRTDWHRGPERRAETFTEPVRPLAYHDGEWRNAAPTTVGFPQPFGRCLAGPMFLGELESLPERYPSLERLGFFVQDGFFDSVPAPHFALMRAEATNAHARAAVNVLDRDGYELTARCVASLVRQLAARPREGQNGAFISGLWADPATFLADLESMGATVWRDGVPSPTPEGGA